MKTGGAGLSRRAFLGAGAAIGGLALLAPTRTGAARAPFDPQSFAPTREVTLTAGEMELKLLGPDKPATRILAYDGIPFQTLRMPRGTRLKATFVNGIDEGSTLHFHGIRMPNEFDGVPTLTQPLVQPGGRFNHLLPLDDPGTFFFHPHCDETGQAGKGLAGVLIVEDTRDPAFDAEHVLCLKDWRLAPDGRFLALSEPEGASKAGTFGATRTVNGAAAVELTAPAGGHVRLRILNIDSTRIMDIGVEAGGAKDAEAWLIAVDGHALTPVRLDDLPDGVWRMGPAQRIDLDIRMPANGSPVTLGDYRAADIYQFATLTAAGKVAKPRKGPLALPKPELPKPDVKKASRLSFTLQQATGQAVKDLALPADDPLAKALIDSLCVGSTTYWGIQSESWPTGSNRNVPPPLARMATGGSYVVEIKNETRFPHPVHLHGHAFEVLSSSLDRLPRHFADTVLVQPGEAVEIAFVAAPGDWVFHCHILEHMETGMMGWFRIV
ncbi:multicopper oxidase family protein [Ancylobacter rudongensis]|uniref:Multicopper oxidase with three cupredoxin domains (Includes cell division protein FtsP and spore coat protein CotA) n=1 Tax=Ancylobacter rudongensis TaxID=177413 RepID=A0A1G4UGL7_9HYPH|nr:multicopper oxidase family protein [Ancylobacter rudongensis]SCW92714.1 Multicopper oxidase with three cupredoxin domains (includes cell division protein FtsP and spore coat protein CotA) [Ancylobacter rudongensis]